LYRWRTRLVAGTAADALRTLLSMKSGGERAGAGPFEALIHNVRGTPHPFDVGRQEGAPAGNTNMCPVRWHDVFVPNDSEQAIWLTWASDG
jgi:hypothetical protein